MVTEVWGEVRASRNSLEWGEMRSIMLQSSIVAWQMAFKLSSLKQQIFDYILLFCGSYIWPALSWTVLLFCVGLTQVTSCIWLADGLLWRTKKPSLTHLPPWWRWLDVQARPRLSKKAVSGWQNFLCGSSGFPDGVFCERGIRNCQFVKA